MYRAIIFSQEFQSVCSKSVAQKPGKSLVAHILRKWPKELLAIYWSIWEWCKGYWKNLVSAW